MKKNVTPIYNSSSRKSVLISRSRKLNTSQPDFSSGKDIGNTNQGQNRHSYDLIKDIQHGRSDATKLIEYLGQKSNPPKKIKKN